MEFINANFFDDQEPEERNFEDDLKAMAEENSLAKGLAELDTIDSWYRDSPDNDSEEHKKIKDKITLQIKFMEEYGLGEEVRRVLGNREAGGSQPELEETQESVRQEAEILWGSGDRVAALEVVLGRSVNTSELQENPIFRAIILARSADEAYGAALMIKTIEENSSIRSQ